MCDSILEKARSEGYSKGWQRAVESAAQTQESYYDDGFAAGCLSEKDAAPSRLRWFLLGLIVGLSALLL